jgi:hypothetical protein
MMPGDKDMITTHELGKSPFQLTRTPIFAPSHVTTRIRAQSGWFTVHHTNPRDTFEPIDQQEEYADKLWRINIDENWIPYLRRSLVNCGITGAFIFPDLEGLAIHLNSLITYGWLQNVL